MHGMSLQNVPEDSGEEPFEVSDCLTIDLSKSSLYVLSKSDEEWSQEVSARQKVG